MNMKRKTKSKFFHNLCQSLAGILFSVSAVVLPVTVYAEAAAPQEQVYLDPSQAEAAKRQKEADAKYNSVPQNSETVAAAAKKEAVKEITAETVKSVEESKEIVKAEAAKEEKTVVAESKAKEEKTVVTESKAKEENKTGKAEVTPATPEAGQAKENAAQQSAEVSRPKPVMPQEQVYLDPSQAEAAKQQKEADAFINSQPQAKNVEVVTGDRVIADVKVVEKDNKANAPATDNISETKQAEEVNNAAVQPEKVQPKKVEPEKPAAPVERKEAKNAATEKAAQPEDKKENKTETPEGQPVLQKKPVRLHHFGLSKEVTTHHATVGEVLQEMKINLDGRATYPSPDTKITDGMVIHVLARKSFLSREEMEVPFGTQVINDPELAFGTKKVEKEGIKGKDLVIYENITRPGREQKIELDRRRVTEPVNEIVRQGVAQSVLTPEGYVRYKKKILGEATAYTWGGGASGHTSVGLWPKRGIVAVDPRVIPYYTKLFIPGYGMAVAGDTGGAIVGTRIDLFMDSLYECYQWGRRDVEIYILE